MTAIYSLSRAFGRRYRPVNYTTVLTESNLPKDAKEDVNSILQHHFMPCQVLIETVAKSLVDIDKDFNDGTFVENFPKTVEQADK